MCSAIGSTQRNSLLVTGWRRKASLGEAGYQRTKLGQRYPARRPAASRAAGFSECVRCELYPLVRGMAGVSVPSRMYNIMAAGKPIIAVADEKSELALVVKEEQIGWVVPPGDVDQLVTAILEAHANPARLTEMGQRARQVAETKYSFERVIESYHSLIQGLGDPLGSST